MYIIDLKVEYHQGTCLFRQRVNLSSSSNRQLTFAYLEKETTWYEQKYTKCQFFRVGRTLVVKKMKVLSFMEAYNGFYMIDERANSGIQGK